MHRDIPTAKLHRAACVADLEDLALDRLHAERRAPERDPVAHYEGMAAGAELIAELRSMCELVEQSARDTWDYRRTMSRAQFEDTWADEEHAQFAAWEKAAKLAACRPEVADMAGHCWDCGRDYRPVTLYPEPVPPGRFLRCEQHARWVVAGDE